MKKKNLEALIEILFIMREKPKYLEKRNDINDKILYLERIYLEKYNILYHPKKRKV